MSSLASRSFQNYILDVEEKRQKDKQEPDGIIPNTLENLYNSFNVQAAEVAEEPEIEKEPIPSELEKSYSTATTLKYINPIKSEP